MTESRKTEHRTTPAVVPVVLVPPAGASIAARIDAEKTKNASSIEEITACIRAGLLSIRTEMDAGSVKSSTLDTLTTNLEGYIIRFDKDQDSLRSKYGGALRQIQALNEAAAVKAGSDAEALESQMRALADRLSKLRAETVSQEETLQAKIAALQVRLQTHQQMDVAKDESIVTLTEQRDSAKSSLTKLSSEAKELRSTLAAVRAENAKMTHDLAGFSTRVTKVERSLGDERAQNRILKSQIADITAARDTALREVSSIPEKLETKRRGYEASLSELRSSVVSNEAKIALLNDRLEHAPWQTLAKAMEESLKLQHQAAERADRAEAELKALRAEAIEGHSRIETKIEAASAEASETARRSEYNVSTLQTGSIRLYELGGCILNTVALVGNDVGGLKGTLKTALTFMARQHDASPAALSASDPT